MTLLDDIARTCSKLIVREPFFGHVVVQIAKTVTQESEAPPIAIALGGHRSASLVVREDHWNENLGSADLRYGAVKHQVLHLVLGHIFEQHTYGHKELFGVAADLVVNQYLRAEELTHDSITLDGFGDLKLPRNLSASQYYKILYELLEEEEDKNEEGSAEQADSSEAGQEPEETEGQDQEEDQQQDGDEQKEEDAQEEPDQQEKSAGGEGGKKPSQGKPQLQKMLQENQRLKEHAPWEALAALKDGDRRVLEAEIDQVVAKSAERLDERAIGDLPLPLRQAIESLRRKLAPQIHWKKALRIFSQSSRKTRIKNTMRRPSRRYGTTPGTRVQRYHRVAVAVDTSASVSPDELMRFFKEIHRIHKQGAEITILECDAAIGRTYAYRGKAPKEISGRGGTRFDPPLRWANQHRPDALIYFTDGHAPAPVVECKTPLMWVICPGGVDTKGQDAAHLPGRRVKMSRTQS